MPRIRGADDSRRPAGERRWIARARGILVEFSRVLVRAADEDQLLRDLCRILVDSGGYRMAWIGLLEHGPDRAIRPVASAGDHDGCLASIKLSWGDNAFGRGPAGTAVRTGAPQTVRNIGSDPRFDQWRSEALARGYRAFAAFPLIGDEEVIGLLGVHAVEPEAFDEDEIALLDEFAKDIAHGLLSLRTRAAQRRAEQLLAADKKVLEMIALGRPLAEVLEGLALAVQQQADGMTCSILLLDPDRHHLRHGAAPGLPASWRQAIDGIEIGPHAGSCGAAAFTGERVITNDIATDPLWASHRAIALEHGLRACWSVPIRSGEHKVLGTFAMYYREPRSPSAAELELADRGVRLALIALERAEAEENLHRFRAAIDASEVLVLLVDPAAMRYVDVNEATCRALGNSREELLAMGPQDMFSGTREELALAYARLIAGDQERSRVEGWYRCKDGSRLPVETFRRVVPSAAGPLIVVVARDITARRRAEEDLRRFRLAMDNSAEIIVLIDRATMHFVDVNSTACGLLGYSREELLSMGPQDVLPVGREELERSYDELIADPSVVGGMKTHYRCKDGSLLPFESTQRVLRSGDTWIIAAISRDIRERIAADEALRASNERFNMAVRATNDVIWDWDLVRNQVWWNENVSSIFGRQREHLQRDAGSWYDEIHPEDRERVVSGIQRLLESGGENWSDEFRIRREDGSYAHVFDRGHVVRDGAGRALRMIGAMADITARKDAEEKLTYLAQFDAVTGLPNRYLFRDRLAQTLTLAQRNRWQVGVMFVDLDRFKAVNDSFGHSAGDKLLASVAARLRESVRGGDTVGRLSGDEFAVVLSSLSQADDAGLVAQKVVAAMARPFEIDGHQPYVTASVGIALYPGDGAEPDELVRNADTAMYRAKQQGRNGYQFYRKEQR